MINGVTVTPLKTFPDDRGYFREIARTAENPLKPFAQLSATLSYPSIIKAFHYHTKQDDLWYVASGNIQAVLYDRREDSPTYQETQVVPMGDHNPVTLFIPHGVVHGYKVVGHQPALVVYATSHEYDPKDELRIAHNDPEINFDWSVRAR